jgi:hypothetical protein
MEKCMLFYWIFIKQHAYLVTIGCQPTKLRVIALTPQMVQQTDKDTENLETARCQGIIRA